MPRLFWPNFAFEHELAGHRAIAPSLKRMEAELAPNWITVADDDDWIALPECVDGTFFRELEALGFARVAGVTDWSVAPSGMQLCPWGWTDSVRAVARRHGWWVRVPEQNVVRRVNARSFAVALEAEWGVGLEGSAAVHTLEELTWHLVGIHRAGSAWVVKAEFGMAGRERILGRGRELTTAQRNWVDKRLRRDGTVIVEPWLERVFELGLQFIISPTGTVRFHGATKLLTDRLGKYRGSRLPADSASPGEHAEMLEIASRAAARLAEMGYFGPLGIDAACYRLPDGTLCPRPLQDLNARWTMGHLALGVGKLLSPGQRACWLTRFCPAATIEDAVRWRRQWNESLPSGCRLIFTSPLSVGGRICRCVTAAVMAPDERALQVAERQSFTR